MNNIGDDLGIQVFLNDLEVNPNLKQLSTNFDNNKVPIHRWFPFLAGFSHKLVGETVKYFSADKDGYTVFDPFMGSGTTGVVGNEHGVNVIGNESNVFLHEICELKTTHEVDPTQICHICDQILKEVSYRWEHEDLKNEHLLLKRCYSENNLKKLVALRELLQSKHDIPQKYKKYLFLAITMSLPKSANVRINTPYISWRHKRTPNEAFLEFKKNVHLIKDDLSKTSIKTNAKVNIHLHDSRKKNTKINDHSIDLIFTSPPYLNNLDYGEALKVFLYFWKVTENWGDITEKVRKSAVTSSTTYYSNKTFNYKVPQEIIGNDFISKMPNIAEQIISKIDQISIEKNKRKSKKSFDTMTALYFKDMLCVIEEMHRVLKKNAFAFIVIGDSAPYSVHVPTDVILGEMAVASGFRSYTLKPLRSRGTKWKNLRYRHNIELRESLLVLRK